MEKQEKKPFYKGKKFIYGVIIFFAIGIVGSALDDPAPRVVEPVANQQKEEVKENEEEVSYAFKLASLDDGVNKPKEVSIAAFENILASLQESCPNESEADIAGYIFKGAEILQEKNIQTSLFWFGKSMTESFPEGVDFVKCAEVAAMLVALSSTN